MKLTNVNIVGATLARRRLILIGTAALLGFAALASGAGAGVDELLKNGRYGIRSRPATGQIHVVEIDARSIKALERWPWSRGVHAELIDRLYQGGARSIAFDVDFSSISNPAEDAKLAAALERAGGNVVLPTIRQSAGAGSFEVIETEPAKPFANKAFLAAVNVVPDADGYIRHMPLGMKILDVPRPALAAMVSETDAEIGRFFEIDYAIEPQTIPRHSVIDVISGKVPASEIAGKRFVIGATAVEIGDRYAVPRHGVIPGVVIQALGAETLMQGPVPQNWGGLLPLLMALGLIGCCLKGRSRPLRIALFAAGSAAVLVLPLATEMLFAISMPLAPALAALGIAALLGAAAFGAERFQERAQTDAETGLPNLTALELAANALERRNVVVARIDRFAAIASGLGPAATTTLIQRVADRLRYTAGQQDIYRTDDATLAWIEDPDDFVTLEDRIEAIAAVMRSPVDCGRLIDVTLTFGLADDEEEDAKQLVADASLAAVHASQAGVKWERFSHADSDETNWHLSLLGELDAAMEAGHLWNAYQPKLDIRSGRIIGAEALVRWHHPERGPIQPDRFIPIVEEHGRARDLTAHVLAQALEDALHWDQKGFVMNVAVNVSATLLADHEFIEMVGQRLQASPVPNKRITIEVTESAAMDSPERAIAALESWRALGVAISIDDYGTGQSSLGYLQKLPATELKIDKSFVQTIGSDKRNEIMVRSTVALAHELGMKVVAEGIEDEACLQILRAMECDTAQGYHIGRPMAADAMTEYLSERARDAA